MLLPLQGVLLFSIRTPKALPWAMCFWGFQPVLLTFDTPSTYLIFAFLTAQNCELNAQRNLLLEIREFCACSVMLFVYNKLGWRALKCANSAIAKGLLLHCRRSPFAMQLSLRCIAIVLILHTKKPPFALQWGLNG